MKFLVKYGLVYRILCTVIFFVTIIGGGILLGFGLKDMNAIKLPMVIIGSLLMLFSILIPLFAFFIQVEIREDEVMIKRFFIIRYIKTSQITSLKEVKRFCFSFNASNKVIEISYKVGEKDKKTYISLLDSDSFITALSIEEAK